MQCVVELWRSREAAMWLVHTLGAPWRCMCSPRWVLAWRDDGGDAAVHGSTVVEHGVERHWCYAEEREQS